MKLKKGRSPKQGKRMAVRRRKRTFEHVVPLSVREGSQGGGVSSRSRAGVASRMRSRAVGWTWSRVLALLIAVTMAALVVWFFADPSFYVYEAQVEGTALVSEDAVYRASGLDTLSIFYVSRSVAAEDIARQVLGVIAARVDCQLPGQVRIRIREQDVRFLWRTAGAAFLVDGGGQVLKVDDGTHHGLISISDLNDGSLKPGDQVDRAALNAARQLSSLLPEVSDFEYSQHKGISVLDARGWRLYFGDDRSLEQKVASMRALLHKIQSEGVSVKYIDLRFVGSPYYE
jgi:cell division septal protein FtsQ